MELQKKISWYISLQGMLCGLFGALVAIGGIASWSRLYQRICGHGVELTFFDLLPLLALLGLVIGFLVGVLFLFHLLRRVVRPVIAAAKFADDLASGEIPSPLPVNMIDEGDEVNSLYRSLNFLRDRQLNLTNKLKLSISRETEIRREIERHDTLQLRMITRLLPEMRQPLGAVKGFALLGQQELREHAPGEAVDRHLEDIVRRVGKLSRLLERMIDIGALVRERWSMPRSEEFNTAVFIRELIELNSIALKAREVMLINHFSASAPEALISDRELLFQLLTLLIRAVGRASAIGETVVLSCFREKRQVIFEVRDSRTGPCREDLARLYSSCGTELEPLESFDHVSVNVLGLCFVREIAKKLGCRLEVASTEQSHTQLRLVLNEKDCVPDSVAEALESWRGGTKRTSVMTEEEEQCLAETPIRVLLCGAGEDEEAIMPLLLRSEHIEVLIAHEEETMVSVLKQTPCDALVIADVKPGFDVVGLISHLRAVSGHRELPALVITTWITPEGVRRLRELERVNCMVYPLNYALLAKQLHALVGRRAESNSEV